jgi:hypothetical protein
MTHNNLASGLNQTAREGYQTMREYTDKAAELAGSVSSNLHDFTKREPWLALIAAFAIGFTMAKVMHRVLGKSSE